MSEPVGDVAREVFDRARAHVVALRCAYFQRLADVAELARSGWAVQTGYRSTESLLADRDNLDHADAKRLVAEAADLCARSSLAGEPLPARLPCTGEALATGLIDPAHVKIIRDTMQHLDRLDRVPPAEWAGAEETLARHAQLLPPRMLRDLAKKIVDYYDPDGAAPDEGEDSRDELWLHRRRDGSLVVRGWLHDPLDAEMVVEVFGVLATRAGADDPRSQQRRNADALKDLTQDARGPRGLATDTRRHTPDADEAGLVAEPGDDNAGPVAEAGEDEDTHPEEAGPVADPSDDQAAAEEPPALIPEPRRATPGAPTGRGWTERPGRALLTVTIDHRWLCEALADKGGYGTLDSGHHVDAATVRRWACDAEIVPMVLGSRSEPLDVGRTQRTAPDAIRRALNIRDAGCAFPGCDRAPRRCQAHHVQEWFDHGATAVENMCLLCRYHHRLIHYGHWTIEMIDGRPWFTPPGFIDTERQPRPGGRPHVPL